VIAALREAKERGVVLQLVVAGDGPERENLMRQSREQGVSGQVRFLGNQSHRQVLSLMKTCLAFVLASRAEGMPLVIAEAMACAEKLSLRAILTVFRKLFMTAQPEFWCQLGILELSPTGLIRLCSDSSFSRDSS
jgi:glycosyltransferase involved in cell wall biosynthesis